MRWTTAVAAFLFSLSVGQASAQWEDVRIGVEGAYPPFSSVTSGGKLEGFDIDIARALCDEMRVRCQFVRQTWDGMISGLIENKFDAVVASMSITNERKKRIDFTNKYYHIPAKFVARSGSTVEISSNGLRGKRIGVQQKTTHEKFVVSNFSQSAEIVPFRTQIDAFDALVAGEVDLLLADSAAISKGFLDTARGEEFAFVGPDFNDTRWFGQGAGIAIRKEDKLLRNMFNDALSRIRQDGTYDGIAEQYFDFNIYGAS